MSERTGMNDTTPWKDKPPSPARGFVLGCVQSGWVFFTISLAITINTAITTSTFDFGFFILSIVYLAVAIVATYMWEKG